MFYIYDGGQHGLIAATTDTGFSQTISWHEELNKRINARSDGIGAGAANTAIMITKRGEYSNYSNYVTPSAATLWHQYPPATGGWAEADGVIYGDWYLPSKHELSLMIGNNSAASLNLTGSAGYWSSNENVSGFKPNEAWRHLLGSNADSVAKSSYARVRMIREF